VRLQLAQCKSRRAKVGDNLRIHFFHTRVRCPENATTAVCVLPGTELVVGQPRRRTQRHVPSGRLQRDALQCGLCLGRTRLRLASRVDRPDRAGHRSPHHRFLRPGFRRPDRGRIPIRHSGRARHRTPADNRSAGEIAAALQNVDLGHLAAHLDEDAPWDRILSGGEKQRLAFARVFLMRPDIVVLDEATAAFDLPSQDQLMKRLMREV
jgi:ABC-type dipeptide/oligopeptide/nickel transport system ATPase subunit